MGLLDFLFGSDVGSGEYTEKDVMKDTGDSLKNVREAGHQFRDDSGVRKGNDETQNRNFRFDPRDGHGDSHYVRGPKARNN